MLVALPGQFQGRQDRCADATLAIVKAVDDWDRLPKFLMADDGGDRMFVVHCHQPRFIMEFDDAGEGTPLWIDAPTGLDVAAAARLMREAGDFYAAEIERE
jgi:hypothetical protein